MSGAKVVRTVPVTEAAAHGACLVCTVLRHHQTRLVEVTGLPKASHLCNHHAWLLARSAPATLATEIYTQVLDARRRQGARSARVCAFCADLRREEAVRLDELVEQVKMPSFAEWMRRSGTLCLWHAHQLSHRLPTKERALVEEVLARTAEELDVDLGKCAVQARHGQHAGSGVLGRVAEFLVCQRGIPGEETPC
jgi:hypothetical protein